MESERVGGIVKRGDFVPESAAGEGEVEVGGEEVAVVAFEEGEEATPLAAADLDGVGGDYYEGPYAVAEFFREGENGWWSCRVVGWWFLGHEDCLGFG